MLSRRAGCELSLVTGNPEVRDGFPNCSKIWPILQLLLLV